MRNTEDINDWNNLNKTLILGRLTYRVPSSTSDVISGDIVGDFCPTPNYLYILISNSGSPIWLRLSSSWSGDLDSFIIECSDETTALVAASGVRSFRMTPAFTISDIRASVVTAPVGATLLTVDVLINGSSILSTKLTFDSGEKTTKTAATQRVISSASIADDDVVSIDIISVGETTPGAGLKVSIVGSDT